METPRFIRKDVLLADEQYRQWLHALKERFRQAQIRASVRVNAELLNFYWQLGGDIAAMQAESKYGSAFFDCLSLDLKAAFPGQSGFSSRNLRYAYKWFRFYNPKDMKLHQAGAIFEVPASGIRPSTNEVPQMPSDFEAVPWRHHTEIITHCKSIDEALFYIEKTIENGWSRRQLEDNLSTNLYARRGTAVTNFEKRLPAPQGKLAQELIKSPYNFEFLAMKEGYNERELEEALCHNITRFLLELGRGFAFVGRQMELAMPGGQTFVPDLIFYHTKLKCYCVVELKVTDYIPEFAGKLNFYVTAIDRLMKETDDRPTIGLLICRSADRTIVEWSLNNITSPLGIATYQIQEVVTQTLAAFQSKKNT